MTLVRVHTPTLTVDDAPLPDFLIGLEDSSLVSLLWTDKALGMRDYGWWPVDAAPVQFDALAEGVASYLYKANDATKRVAAIPVIGPLPAEQIALNQQKAREQAKRQRAAAVDRITVTTAACNCFDGDEVSQGRMARAILALESKGQQSTRWVLSNNSAIMVTPAELREALVLAGEAQTALWVI